MAKRAERSPLPLEPSEPRVLWDAFCDQLKRVGDVLERGETPLDPRTQAEAFRYLVRTLRVGFENAHELADVTRPRLVPMVGPTVQYEGVTSDARYLHTFIDGSANYCIRGDRGEAPLIEFGVYTGKMGMHEESHLVTSLTEADLEVSHDGRIEVWIGPDEHAGNWIRTDAAVRYAMVRQYAADWSGLREGQFAIDAVGAPAQSEPFGLPAMRDSLERTLDFATTNPALWAGISDYWKDFAPNRFVPQLEADAMTDIAPPSGHHFSCGYFQIEPGQVLDIRFSPEGAGFWSLGLANYWYETIGYGLRSSHLNVGHAVVGADGLVRVALSLEAPPADSGIPNWLDPRGHREGTMVFRWSRPSKPIPQIACRLVAREDL